MIRQTYPKLYDRAPVTRATWRNVMLTGAPIPWIFPAKVVQAELGAGVRLEFFIPFLEGLNNEGVRQGGGVRLSREGGQITPNCSTSQDSKNTP